MTYVIKDDACSSYRLFLKLVSIAISHTFVSGNLLKIKVSLDGHLSLLAKADLHGGASPATLQVNLSSTQEPPPHPWI